MRAGGRVPADRRAGGPGRADPARGQCRPAAGAGRSGRARARERRQDHRRDRRAARPGRRTRRRRGRDLQRPDDHAKPPRGLAGAPYLAEHGITLENLRAPLKVFEGSARDGARGFPANVNVAAALSLAGIGPDRTRLEIWADPDLERNVHQIVVEAEAARFEMRIENVPSEDNPRTGRLTPLSVIAALNSLTATLRVGS
ncbi:MAG TPA: aspartate dehydrogenase domain-containing protein [Geminicoccaceae bacterium]|nr:aspartate dehydrogenase domain-containing protein [Geminicoccaceae bacterium]